jgi:hypothetical protein
MEIKMVNCTELWVNRKQFRETKIVSKQIPNLDDGQVLVSIDKFALTANNVTYALVGDVIGYWNFYPADKGWGKVPVWGCATVVSSSHSEIPEGEKLWGFFPMASHVVLQPGKIKSDHFFDMTDYRQVLPGLYNGYRRTQAEPKFLQAIEDQRCLYFPLLATSFLLYDYLVDNDFFGAEQVVIGSVSSKTAFGLAKMLSNDPNVTQQVIGLTSPGNVDFVKGLDCCDQVLVYGDENHIDATKKTAYVDMSGDVRLTKSLHQRLNENMVESCMVGATHWENRGDMEKLPGAKPTMFFAPAQVEKRDAEWGSGVVMGKAMAASAEVVQSIEGLMNIEWTHGAEALQSLWVEMLDNKVSPNRSQMVSLT